MLGVTGRTRWRLLIAFVWGPHVAARGRTSGADPSVGRLAFVDYLVSHVSLPSRTSPSPPPFSDCERTIRNLRSQT